MTAPGSTFKIVAATAGVMEGVVGAYDTINCTGKFQLIPPDVNCWIYSERYKSGSHGPLTLSQAIKNPVTFISIQSVICLERPRIYQSYTGD